MDSALCLHVGFSLLEEMAGVTPSTTGPTASMMEETAARLHSPLKRYRFHHTVTVRFVSPFGFSFYSNTLGSK